MSSLAELDHRLKYAEDLFQTSEDEARLFLASFEFATPPVREDPFSDAYAATQWDLYRHVSGRDSYAAETENSVFDLARAANCPFPYNCGSQGVVGDYIIGMGHILKYLPVPPPARIVEFGAGWGNLTVALALMGYDVTVVEVGTNFGELLRARTESMCNVHIVIGDMLDFEPDGSYDVALFFESFHHCSDHLRMLEQLHDIVGRGAIAFAAEPIRRFAYPWGLRLDGMSLWSTRRYGWLELGFDLGYFKAALTRTGWSSERRVARLASPLADVIVARA